MSSAQSDPATHPLLGVGTTTPRDRCINITLGLVAVVLVLFTLISSFVFPSPPRSPNVFFAVCLILLCISHLVLIFWYRQGYVDGKVRYLIYYNTLIIILLCISANVYFHE